MAAPVLQEREAGPAVCAAAEAVARRSHGRLLALLAARTRDLAGAEDALAEAFAVALVDWSAAGVPRRPEAWLLTVARRKWIDERRRGCRAERAAVHLHLLSEEAAAAARVGSLPDERLGLMFACAHPDLDPGIRAPLILQTVLGLEAAAIGAALSVSPAAMAQRLVRAKRRIREAGIPLRVPERGELAPRLAPVLDALHAAFVAASTHPGLRRDLAEDAIWLAGLVASLLPDEPGPRRLLTAMRCARERRPDRRAATGGGEWSEGRGREAGPAAAPPG